MVRTLAGRSGPNWGQHVPPHRLRVHDQDRAGLAWMARSTRQRALAESP